MRVGSVEPIDIDVPAQRNTALERDISVDQGLDFFFEHFTRQTERRLGFSSKHLADKAGIRGVIASDYSPTA